MLFGVKLGDKVRCRVQINFIKSSIHIKRYHPSSRGSICVWNRGNGGTVKLVAVESPETKMAALATVQFQE